MKDLKANILSNLDFLPTKVNFRIKDNELVILESNYFEPEKLRNYYLKVEVYVFKTIESNEIVIKDFNVENIICFFDNGFDAPFKFTKTELTDYIDF